MLDKTSPRGQAAVIAVARSILTQGSTRKMDWPGVIVEDSPTNGKISFDARTWAVDTFGIPNMKDSVWCSTGHVFFFKNPEDLTLFKLKWS